ncbi:MAG: hypothetical protein HY209_00785 [Candidatus Omnitrophica bacterium]|nr:hypothetical protein [Candidatus Omnitrophota bacterium]
MTLILSPLESLISGGFGSVAEGQKKIFHTMHNNTVRLLQMVQGLLDFQKLEAKKVEVKREPTDIVALTRSLVEDFQPMTKQRGLDLRFEPLEGKGSVLIDRYLYERIVFNLLSNAAKFTPAGGKISVSLQLERDRLRFSCRDTGIGISASDVKGLFQKFKQVEGASTRRFEGAGLGLALVKEFAVAV